MKEQVQKVLDEIRPQLQVGVEAGVVKVQLQGACAGCPMSTMTLKNGIERLLKQQIPAVKEVVNVR